MRVIREFIPQGLQFISVTVTGHQLTENHGRIFAGDLHTWRFACRYNRVTGTLGLSRPRCGNPKSGQISDQISVEVDLNLAFWTSVVVLRLYSATSRRRAAFQRWTYGHVWEIGIIPQALPSQGHQMDLSLLLAIGNCVSVFDNMQNLEIHPSHPPYWTHTESLSAKISCIVGATKTRN